MLYFYVIDFVLLRGKGGQPQESGVYLDKFISCLNLGSRQINGAVYLSTGSFSTPPAIKGVVYTFIKSWVYGTKTTKMGR